MAPSLVATCGLDCATCAIHLATLETSPAKRRRMRVRIARMCREQYGMRITAKEVTDCDGCRSESGRLFSGCGTCEIRKCAVGRNLASCAYCSSYACGMILRHFESDPGARGRIESMRAAR